MGGRAAKRAVHFNKELDPSEIDLKKTYTDEFVTAALRK